MQRGVVAVAVIVCAVTLAAAPALAFRPSSNWVFGKVMERARDRATTSLKVEATTSAWDVTGKTIIEAVPERVWLVAPGKLRRELDVAADPVVEVRADGRLTVRAPGKPEAVTKPGLDLLADIMTAPSGLEPGPAAQKLLASIKALGINPEVVSYARFDGRVAYLVGSKPWETDKSQLWIDKDLLVPLRLVTFIKEGSATTRLDLRYLGWGSPVGGSWYPQVVEIWRGDAVIRRTVTESLDRNTTIDGELFR